MLSAERKKTRDVLRISIAADTGGAERGGVVIDMVVEVVAPKP